MKQVTRTEKQSIITEYLSGGTSTRKLGIKYGYGHVTISRWIMAHNKYGKPQPAKIHKEKPPGHLPNAIFEASEAMPSDVKELQAALLLSRLKVDLLEAMIDISDEQFGTDIRKKAGTSQS